jgi:hypothetical protein
MKIAGHFTLKMEAARSSETLVYYTASQLRRLEISPR